MNKDTKSYVSNFESCPSTKFGKLERKGLGAHGSTKIPGVGECTSLNYFLDDVNKEEFNSSKYYIRGGNKFGSGMRKGLNDTTLQTPGPGS